MDHMLVEDHMKVMIAHNLKEAHHMEEDPVGKMEEVQIRMMEVAEHCMMVEVDHS